MPNQQAQPGQKAPRANIQARCLLHNGTGHVHNAVIEEQSETGLRIRFSAPISLPQHVEVSCQSLGLCAHARVIWQRPGIAGLSLVPGDAGAMCRNSTV